MEHLVVNGHRVELGDVPSMLLIEWLHDLAGLAGTHRGCDTAQCGACTVLIDDEPVKACSVLIGQVAGSRVTTVEGLADGETLHPLQRAFLARGAVQCGYCTAGMLMAGVAMLVDDDATDRLDESGVRRRLEGNLCRCTGYQPIVEAILDCGRAR